MTTRRTAVLLVVAIGIVAFAWGAVSAPAQEAQQRQFQLQDKKLFIAGSDATQPLAWTLGYAMHYQYQETPYFGTAVVVRSAAPEAITVEIEWFDRLGDSLGVRRGAIEPGRVMTFVTNDDVKPYPFEADDNAHLGYVDTIGDQMYEGGYANVHSSHPAVLVTAFLYARDGRGENSAFVSTVNVPTFAVGETRELFMEH